MAKALAQARPGRLQILGKMAEALDSTAATSRRMRPHRDHPNSRREDRDVIGPGGKMIRSIIERTGVKIDVEDSGSVNVASADGAPREGHRHHPGAHRDARAQQDLYRPGERITDFGAFVEIMPGSRSACFTSRKSQLSREGRAGRVEGGQQVMVKGNQHQSIR